MQSQQEILVATPRRVSAEDLHTCKRRKTIPSPESSRSKDLIFISASDTIDQCVPKGFTVKHVVVKLNDGVQFLNEPFENTVVPSESFKLLDFIRAGETKIGDEIFLDSPFSGYMEGTRLAHSIMRIPSDDPHEPKQKWIRCHWVYLGQNSTREIVDGVCGSPIWDANRRVLGFFRYAHTSGTFKDFCSIIAVDHLLDKGYHVV
ncbi:uncharacterized protein N7525_001276 [Penicillium rubens]|uniref:uncharacterized protein n=1 Tax=Penicillium rubens TaxID=1108849 RepID=UPI002A5A855B|nr:uncharacterized protein N7525_001276 [Penicillium rubens]KAJ5843535.1 hypothetical protein N7525_001276 [Penicillium rubens]KAJ5845880.1 hypothetical protein N7534_009549 [Penicillium rubens]